MALDLPVANAVVEMLRRHYLPDGRLPGGIFAAEIESPDGRRRADAIWAPWSFGSDRLGLVGHEVKVSRSDVIAELADPMKADPWARYCGRWWLVLATPGLTDGLDVPDHWGIMAPPSGRRTRTMTVVRPAPALKSADPGPGWRRIATWEHHRLTARIADLTSDLGFAKRTAEYAQRELDEIRLAGAGREHPQAVELGRLLAALKTTSWAGRIDVDQVAAAILDVEEYRRLRESARSELRYLIDEVRRAADPMKRIASDLERLDKAQHAAADVEP